MAKGERGEQGIDSLSESSGTIKGLGCFNFFSWETLFNKFWAAHFIPVSALEKVQKQVSQASSFKSL